jgi:hypothetical protein
MSVFHKHNVTCPHCATEVELDVNFSVNADRRPDYRQAILDGSFQVLACPACAASFRVEPELSYLDMGRHQWILVKPARELDQWEDLERMAEVIFEANYGPGAAKIAQELGAALNVRVTFGWPALREKILLQELGIDETALELLKLALLRSDEAPPISDSLELRLWDRVGDSLRLAWVDADSGEIAEGLELPAEALSAYQPVPPAWAEVAARLTAGPYRDLQRLMVAPA